MIKNYCKQKENKWKEFGKTSMNKKIKVVG
jgi:hypothetical protein